MKAPLQIEAVRRDALAASLTNSISVGADRGISSAVIDPTMIVSKTGSLNGSVSNLIPLEE
jgi:hypothetical protein